MLFTTLLMGLLSPACDGADKAGDDSAATSTGEDTSSATETTDTSPPETVPADPSGAIPLGDDNNYRFEGYLDGPTFPVAELADVRLDWSGVTEDFQCHGLDPTTEIDNVALLIFPYLTEEEVEAGLSADDIQQTELGAYVTMEPEDGVTSAALSEFTFFGTEANIQTELDADSGTWLLLLTTGTTVGVGARMIAFLDPDPGSSETSVSVGGGCSVLDYTADLERLDPTGVLAEGPWLVDWSALTEDGRGGEIDLGDIDGVMIGRYDGWTLETLATDFLDLESNATQLWTQEVSGAPEADLSQLTDAEGAAFTGFSDIDGVWILALRCSTCANPAPPFLTVLIP